MLRLRINPRDKTDALTIQAYNRWGVPITITITNETNHAAALGITAPEDVGIYRLRNTARPAGQTDAELLAALVPLK